MPAAVAKFRDGMGACGYRAHQYSGKIRFIEPQGENGQRET